MPSTDNAPEAHTATTNWESKLHALTWTLKDDAPRNRHGKWREVFDSQLKATPLTITALANPLFSLPLAEDEEEWTVWLEKEELWKRYRTLSHVAVLEGEGLENARKVFDEALSSPDVERNNEGKIAVHGRTVMAWTSKIPA
ncbi:hypothetical protein LTS18_003715 [Coniosporium uncinatum]|uniref:Uncharacterized protein n=1 Tax=Coniosporium uncinatum TaxID=93489 RepID=A0ACC3DT50_9PEZI|nr:hypothetical protein LTS18_003715 [Coniosporium uncinatum]